MSQDAPGLIGMRNAGWVCAVILALLCVFLMMRLRTAQEARSEAEIKLINAAAQAIAQPRIEAAELAVKAARRETEAANREAQTAVEAAKSARAEASQVIDKALSREHDAHVAEVAAKAVLDRVALGVSRSNAIASAEYLSSTAPESLQRDMLLDLVVAKMPDEQSKGFVRNRLGGMSCSDLVEEAQNAVRLGKSASAPEGGWSDSTRVAYYNGVVILAAKACGWSDDDVGRFAQRKPWRGMSRDQLRVLRFAPTSINRAEDANGPMETWNYDGPRGEGLVAIFRRDKLEQWSEH